AGEGANRAGGGGVREGVGWPEDPKDARIAELEAELGALRNALPPPERTITPRDGDIVPPGEQGKLYVGPVVGPDDHRARPGPVIDGKAVPPAPTAAEREAKRH